jgi:glyoxylase-like metal-dependent hydrolase (beta-lactamase superfamily II)
MDKLWGKTLPAPAEQVRALHDGETIEACGLTFLALDTPGHANHHIVYRLGDVAFTGDVTAIRLPGSSFISLPAPPPEFNRETWQDTIDRLLDQRFARIYPTHFGPIAEVDSHLKALSDLVEASAEFVRARMQLGFERDALADEYLAWVNERAYAQGLSEKQVLAYELANPTLMSVDGLMRYWRKQAEV